MESGRILRNTQIIILGVCIAGATIVSSIVLSQGILKVMKFTREVIKVTGSAQKNIRSDYIVWRCMFTRRDADLTIAYKNLKADLEKIKSYLTRKGVNQEEVAISQISTDTIYRKNEKGADTNEIEAYRLSQTIDIRSYDVDRITEVSRESTELLIGGIQLESYSPEYFYTKLDELKPELLAMATENAKLRALNMAKATGNKIGFMRAAKTGVFQITPVNSTEVADWGVNDTSSLDKKVTAVVNVTFSIE